MSPKASWAKWVIPTLTDPSVSPGVRIHSCSAVYFRSSGYTALLVDGRLRATRSDGVMPGRLPAPGGARRGGGWSVGLANCDEVRLWTAVMSSAFCSCTSTVAPESWNSAIGPSLRLRAPCRVWGSPITSKTYGDVSCDPVDLDARRRRLHRALGHQSHLAVDLHRLGAGRPELLDGVEHGVDVDVLRTLGDRDPDAGAGHRDGAGQDRELLRLLLGRGQGRALGQLAALELTAPGLAAG